MRKIQRMWRVLATDLAKINRDTSFAIMAREKARQLKNTLIGKRFLVLFQFLFDITHELNFWSLELQRRSGLLIDFSSFKNRLTGSFHLMKTDFSKHLTSFLNSAKCENNGVATVCASLDNYYRSSKVTYKDIELLNGEDLMPELSSIREIYLNSPIGELDSYFSDGSLEDFDIFSPAKMPNTGDEVKTRYYGLSEISRLSTKFEISETYTMDEWQTLLLSIVRSKNYCTIKRDEAEALDFWSELLRWTDITWGPNIKRLVQTILVLPISSAEAERGFSTLNYIRNDRRKCLSGGHLEDIMRIKLNGPEDLNKFGASKYAAQWIREGHLRTDDPQGQKGSKKKKELEENEENKK